MRRSLLHRLTGMLVAALLLFSWTGEALGQHACPHHDSVPGAAAHAGDGDHAAHGMAAHAASSTVDQDHDSADQDQDRAPVAESGADQDHNRAPSVESEADQDHDAAPATVSEAGQDHDQAAVIASAADRHHDGAPAAESEHQHDSCTCLGSCPSAAGEALPPDPDAGLRVVPTWVRQARSDDASAVTLLLLPFFLPYGQAPPLLG